MGKADTAVKNWLNDNERFADLFNGIIFDGKQVIHPDELENLDRETDIIITDRNGRQRGLQRHRDLAKRWKKQVDLAVLACESQDKIHYAMPVRSMLNGSLTYTDQVREIWRDHKKKKEPPGSTEVANNTSVKGLTQEEYLSRFRKDDRIYPVISIVFYYDLKLWDGAKDLYDMFHLKGELKDLDLLQRFIPNYHINLLDAGNISCPGNFHSDLQQIFQVLKCREDKDAIQDYMKKNRSYFENVDVETYQAMRALLHSERVMADMSKYNSGKETRINMCKALEDIYADGMQSGLEKGKLILIRNMLSNGMSAEDIKKYTGASYDMISTAQEECLSDGPLQASKN